MLLLQGKRAGVACMATTWFETYKRNVLKFINETGMEGLETDGKKTALFVPFIYQMHHFTKTGSGQT